MKKDFYDNLEDIFNSGYVENIKLNQMDTIKEIFKNKEISSALYENFKDNFNNFCEHDDLFSKTQDLVYRLNYVLENCIESSDIDDIVDKIKISILNGMDYYSAVSYDESDIEIKEEYEDRLSDISI